MKFIEKIKNYCPTKYICYLFLLFPILLLVTLKLNREQDIWFILNHGKYVLNHGIPTIEPFSMHQGFSFVMQQWLSAVIFYVSYLLFKQWGILLIVCITFILFMYFLYKLCMLLSDNKYFLSTLVTVLSCLFLNIFFTPRPQIFTYLMLMITLYIIELYNKNSKSKAIYFLPLISLLQINLHSSMWFMMYLFLLPYIIYFGYLYKKQKDKKVIKLMVIILIMLIMGFINPYGIDAITYVFKSYNNYFIDDLVFEMQSPSINENLGIYVFIAIGVLFSIYIFNKKGKMKFTNGCLLLGTLILALKNYRNFPLFIIATYPFLASYLKNSIKDDKENNCPFNIKKYYTIVTTVFIIYFSILAFMFQGDLYNKLEKGVDILIEKSHHQPITVFCDYDSGGYLEYRGIKPYMDNRAEVFLKSNNKKEDILKEYNLVEMGMIDYDKFLEKYNFTHLLINNYIKNNHKYKPIFQNGKYIIYEKE